jgi:Spy/CpxP family protein refolding chaperone
MTKTTKIIFTLSLIANLALFGIIAGNFYKRVQRHMPPAELSPKSQQILEDNIKASKETMRPDFKKMKQFHEELKEIMTAENFDIEAYNMAVERILNAKDRFARQKAVVMGRTLAQLPPDERKKFSEHVVRSFSPKHGRKHRPDREGRPPENDD